LARLVVVSNRVTGPRDRAARAGGLAVALRGLLQSRGGIWFGWSGDLDERLQNEPEVVSNGPLTYATLDLTPEEHRQYYVSYANGAIWPVFHYRLGVRNRIGFFLHIPFPVREVLNALPGAEHLLAALCEYDLIGLQTDGDVEALGQALQQDCGLSRLGDGEFDLGHRCVRVAAFPIGIDSAQFSQLAARSVKDPEPHRLRESLRERDLIIGVDRLDYSKGLRRKFEAVHAALQMPLAARQLRWRRAMATIEGHSAENWGEDFLDRLAA
jgi:trehalose 6-phosphate synthase